MGRPASATTRTGSLISSLRGSTTTARSAPEGDRLDGPRHERRPGVRAGGRDRPDGERGVAEPVGQPQAHLGAGGLRADDHAQGASGERLVRWHGLRAGLPRRHPTGRAPVGRSGREVRQGHRSRCGSAGDRQAPEHRRQQEPTQATDRPPTPPVPHPNLRPTGIISVPGRAAPLLPPVRPVRNNEQDHPTVSGLNE